MSTIINLIYRIDVYVRRLGGGYGIKISRTSQPAVACALVTKFLNRPCRFIQSLTTNMRAVGKRFPCAVDFEARNIFPINELFSSGLKRDRYYNYSDWLQVVYLRLNDYYKSSHR